MQFAFTAFLAGLISARKFLHFATWYVLGPVQLGANQKKSFTFHIFFWTEYRQIVYFSNYEIMQCQFRHDGKRIYIELKTYFSNPSTSKVTWKILLLQMSFPIINFPFMMTQESWCIFSGKLLQKIYLVIFWSESIENVSG